VGSRREIRVVGSGGSFEAGVDDPAALRNQIGMSKASQMLMEE